MKKVLFILMAFLCVSNTWGSDILHYRIILDEASVNDSAQGTYDKASMTFADKSVGFGFLNEGNRLKMILMNTTDKTISVDWDGIVWVNFNGYADGVVHIGNSYMNKGMKRAPSQIIAGAKLSDILAPKSNLSSSGSLSSLFNGMFNFNGMRSYNKQRVEYIKRGADGCVGKKFTVMIPVTIDGEVKEYKFTFMIDEVTFKKLSTKQFIGE